ncbi:alanine--tRNA ligase [Desulforhabdus amnigena]|jgi:alanyl-tRNA synthetase|uniref:Alanine--tRNA ligase n=1 Tax=Desulforhabdus amnigena TaxID=40218 RepID=A0A9W6LA79_9BACT|nr:alanine--tRNA ligase [Desulforhabdus amnigena]NLJ28906.1 alanine--tRNA ligase [Deltaproteobacteria bacterium]GLI35641.1 alanine--tRNA ligase [Desulforhabdus amnigena]
MKASEIRKAFLDFFQERGHTTVKSSSLIPHDDPTLLFTNAGMVQFKRAFLGEERRPYSRATTSQKCMRAGGKHNDLENVGRTARHHTFFEMLGNFSFGDYFKREAIEYAWIFLTEVMGLPKDKLYATIHEGDSLMNLGPDEDAREYWKRYLPAERILTFPTKDNFWSMGDTGPCGPCSEILIDQGEAMGCGRADCRPGCDCDRYLELWNLVFMQFNRKEDGTLEPLPKPSIDTGMGLERIAAVIQKVPSNYDTDLFAPMRTRIAELSGYHYGTKAEKDVSVKVIADHSRAAAFLIGDGILPSNEGRGYVLRRVIRRALRHGRFLGQDKPFLHDVVVSVMEAMRDAYPELLENKSYITRVILNEEERFNETLDHGLGLLQNEIKQLQQEGKKTIPGALIFKLYDTFGFPIDIITDMARDLSLEVDEAEFQQLMEKQREQSRMHWKGSGEREVSEAYRHLSAQGVTVRFLGYESLDAESRVLALVREGKSIQEAEAGSTIEVVVAETPFYGAAGGQVGDVGEIAFPSGRVVVSDTLKLPGDLIVHVGKVEGGSLKVGEQVRLKVDSVARKDTALHHTATHILHAVLRSVLGDHVKQAGSLVGPDRLRFDFTHFTAVTPEELAEIEKRVNDEIRTNEDLQVHVMDLEEALKTGAMALFEEKYGDRVRMVEIPGFSRELCGGTHTHRTGDIGLFVIVQEMGIAAGVRRIEALAGRHALAYLRKHRGILQDVAGLLKTSPADVAERVEKLIAQQKQLEKELEAFKASLASKRSADLLERAEDVGGVKVLVTRVETDNPKALRDLNDRFKERLKSGVIVLGAAQGGKVFLLVGVTQDTTSRIHAGNLIKEIVKVVGGSGGGRPDMAQAGGNQPEKLEDALDLAAKLIREKLA